jgi:hypothetical protein
VDITAKSKVELVEKKLFKKKTPSSPYRVSIKRLPKK